MRTVFRTFPQNKGFYDSIVKCTTGLKGDHCTSVDSCCQGNDIKGSLLSNDDRRVPDEQRRNNERKSGPRHCFNRESWRTKKSRKRIKSKGSEPQRKYKSTVSLSVTAAEYRTPVAARLEASTSRSPARGIEPIEMDGSKGRTESHVIHGSPMKMPAGWNLDFGYKGELEGHVVFRSSNGLLNHVIILALTFPREKISFGASGDLRRRQQHRGRVWDRPADQGGQPSQLCCSSPVRFQKGSRRAQRDF